MNFKRANSLLIFLLSCTASATRALNCVSSGEAIPATAQCDGVVDCEDGSDELFCTEGTTVLEKTCNGTFSGSTGRFILESSSEGRCSVVVSPAALQDVSNATPQTLRLLTHLVSIESALSSGSIKIYDGLEQAALLNVFPHAAGTDDAAEITEGPIRLELEGIASFHVSFSVFTHDVETWYVQSSIAGSDENSPATTCGGALQPCKSVHSALHDACSAISGLGHPNSVTNQLSSISFPIRSALANNRNLTFDRLSCASDKNVKILPRLMPADEASHPWIIFEPSHVSPSQIFTVSISGILSHHFTHLSYLPEFTISVAMNLRIYNLALHNQHVTFITIDSLAALALTNGTVESDTFVPFAVSVSNCVLSVSRHSPISPFGLALFQIPNDNFLYVQEYVWPTLPAWGDVRFKRTRVVVELESSAVFIAGNIRAAVVQNIYNLGHRANDISVHLRKSVVDNVAYTVFGFRLDLVELDDMTIMNSGLIVNGGGGTISVRDSRFFAFQFGTATDYLEFSEGPFGYNMRSGHAKLLYTIPVGLGFIESTGLDDQLIPNFPAVITCHNVTFRGGVGNGALIRLLSYKAPESSESSLVLESTTFESISPSEKKDWHLISPSLSGMIRITDATFASLTMAGPCAWLTDSGASVDMRISGSEISKISGTANTLFCIHEPTSVLAVLNSTFNRVQYAQSLLLAAFESASNAILFVNTTVAHCTATSFDGTTMKFSAFAQVHFDNCKLIGNNGKVGGVFRLKDGATVFLNASMVSDNIAIAGGVASVSHGARVVSMSSTFAANGAELGGVFDLAYPAFVTLVDSTVRNNTAISGAVLYVSAVRLDGVLTVEGSTDIMGNRATKGGVVFMPSTHGNLVEVPHSMPFSQSTRIHFNLAEAAGGVLYVAHPRGGIEDWRLFLQLLDGLSFNNSAQTGPLIGSPPLTVEMNDDGKWLVQRSGHVLNPTLNVTVNDHFDQIVRGNWFVRNYDLAFNNVLVRPVVGAVGGVETFEDVRLDVPPGTSVRGTLQVRFTVDDVLLSRAFDFETDSSCLDGEVLDENGVCMPCMRTTFSLMYRAATGGELSAGESMFDTNQCRSCPDGIDCAGGTSLLPSTGYWLRTERSTHVLECLSFSRCSVSDTNVTGQYVQTCKPEGATSPMCLQCKDGYSRWYGECWKCDQKSEGLAFLNFATLACTLLLLVHFYVQNNASYMYLRVLISYLQVIRMLQVIHTDLYGSARSVNSALSIISNAFTAWDNPFVSCALSSLSYQARFWIDLLILPCLISLLGGASVRRTTDRRGVIIASLFQCWYLLHGWLLHLAFAGVTRFTLDKALQDDGVHAYPELQDDSFSSLQYMDGEFYSATNVTFIALYCLAIVVIVVIVPLLAVHSIYSASDGFACGFDRGYRSEFRLWEIYKFFMKCLVAAVIVSFQYKPASLQYLQGFVMLILTVTLGMQAFFMPHKTATLNALDMLSYLALMSAVFGHVMYLAEGLVSELILAPLTAVVVAIPNCVFIMIALGCIARENRSAFAVLLRIK